MAALYERETSGEGQCIDIALLDSIMPLMGWVAANLLIGGQRPALMGNDNVTAAPSGTFATQDGYVNIAANKQEHWEAVADTLGVPELKTDPRFERRDARKKNRKELTRLLEAKLMEHPTSEWVDRLNAKGVPSGGILGLEEALSSAQMQHRGALQEIPVENLGGVKLFNLTAKFSRTPARIECPPPALAQHTHEILAGLGYEDGQIEELRKRGVV
jgi:crotonobetainyl-CoA:carnitine CoA-transferase CaiB-like acyl-CoA transferase